MSNVPRILALDETNRIYDLAVASLGGAGSVGPEGPAGPAGPQGLTGDIGPAGLTGADGAQGPIGNTGPSGADGAQGIQGIGGAAGSDGATGSQGIQGVKGDTGAQGDPGQAWPIGSLFLSVVTTDPATLLGYGTWAAFGAGRMLLGFTAGDTDEATGGAATHSHAFTQPADHAALTHAGATVANPRRRDEPRPRPVRELGGDGRIVGLHRGHLDEHKRLVGLLDRQSHERGGGRDGPHRRPSQPARRDEPRLRRRDRRGDEPALRDRPYVEEDRLMDKSFLPVKAAPLDSEEEAAWFAGRTSRRLLAIPFGGPIPSPKSVLGVDLDGEWFDERTDIYGNHRVLRQERDRIVDFHHGQSKLFARTVIGKATLDDEPDDEGWWVDFWFKAGQERVALIKRLAQRGAQLFGSSEPVKADVDISPSGHIRVWPFLFETRLDLTPEHPLRLPGQGGPRRRHLCRYFGQRGHAVSPDRRSRSRCPPPSDLGRWPRR